MLGGFALSTLLAMSERANRDQELRDRRADRAKQYEGLRRFEERWRDKQAFLERKGYMLRPRYRPGWVASWKSNPQLNPRECEDGHRLKVSKMLLGGSITLITYSIHIS